MRLQRYEAHRGPYVKGSHAKGPKVTVENDPPAIIRCPYCQESVLAHHRVYLDAIDPIGERLYQYTKHRHQPARYEPRGQPGTS